MSCEETKLENRFKILNDQYNQIKSAYLDIKQVYTDQFHQITLLQKDNENLNHSLKLATEELCLTKYYYSDQLRQIGLLQKEKILIKEKLEKSEDQVKELNESVLAAKSENFSLHSEIKELKRKIEELSLKLERQETRPSNHSESLNEFTKSIYSKMVNALPVIVPNIGLYDRHLSEIKARYYSEIRKLSNKFPQDPVERNMTEDSTNLVEAFFVLGIPNRSFGKSSTSPEILYEYKGNKCESFNKGILVEFCFPNEICCKKLEETTSEEINNILFGQTNDIRDSNSYILTLKSAQTSEGLSEFNDLPNADKQYIYCVCIQFQDISIESCSDRRWVSTKCLCIVSHVPCFDLHFQFLRTLLNLKKLWRMEVVADFEDISSSLKQNNPEIPLLCEGLLKSYFRYQNPRPMLKISIEYSSHPCIEYQFPNDLSVIDIPWLVHSLKTKIDAVHFLKLFSALLQEKSLVFISKDLDLVTSSVLAMQALLRPLAWPYFFMPVIPDSLRELLDAPFPILAGVAGEAVADLASYPHIIWVLLDEYYLENRVLISGFQDFHELPNSSKKEEFISSYLLEREEARLASLLKEMISDYLESFKEKAFNNADEIHKMVSETVPKEEQDFYHSLVQTQMFYSFIDKSIRW